MDGGTDLHSLGSPGVWDRLLALVQERGLQLGMTFLDGTNIRAHQKATGAAKNVMLRHNETIVKRLAALVAALELFSPSVWWHTEPSGTEGRAMGQVPHGSATTTQAVRRAIQRSEASVRALALRHGVSPTTVQKWRRRQTTDDVAMGPKQPQSSGLSTEQEAVVVAFRRHTLLPLDDGLYAL